MINMGALYSYFFRSSVEEIDPGTGLTAAQRNIILECWIMVERHVLDIGIEIMIAFFQEYPKYQDEFSKFKGRKLDELKNDRQFHAHCLVIMGTFSQAVQFLHDAELCTAGLHMTGERHARRGQDKIPFDLLEPRVNKILKTRLGEKCTAQVSEALDIAIALMFKGIKDGIDEYANKKKTTE